MSSEKGGFSERSTSIEGSATSDEADVASKASVTTALQAWQDRCAIVEAALAAAHEALQRELPAWQERCAATEAALVSVESQSQLELLDWERRCTATEVALAAANARFDKEVPRWRERCELAEAALVAANARLDEEIPRWRERCELAESALASFHDSRKGRSASFTDATSFLRFASTFTPAQAVGHGKIRVGAPTDGGYVMLDDIVEGSIALSLGVGHDISWDLQMADLGAIVHQYDDSVRPPAGQPSSIVFYPKRIVDVDDGEGVTLEKALSMLEGSNPGRPAILKIDIEGSEWPVLDAVSDAVLRRFDQIVCEYHGFGEAIDPDWFDRASRVATKLNRSFQVVHVHGNNNGPMTVLWGVPFPSVLEVTHVNRSRYNFQPTGEIFPTSLDHPNDRERPDLWLGSFSFQRVS